MPIDKIQMLSFRNHQKTEIGFGPGVNVIWGENGSGKTSVLEAVYLLSMGKSFRTGRIYESINYDQETLRIEGLFSTDKKVEKISFSQAKDRRRKIKINNTDVSVKELIGKNPVVLLSPEEQNITKGAPGDRRRYFDKLYSIISKNYFKNLSDYTTSLKQRNALLKNKMSGSSFSVWDDALAEFGTKIWEEKETLNKKFVICLNTVTKMYNQEEVEIKLEAKADNLCKQQFLQQLKSALYKEKQIGRTSVGPHRDNFTFSFNGKSLREFGSQGEHKISLILIKLAEYMFIQEETGKTPSLLLDDLFAKLDFERSDAVLKLLEKKTQTIITNTDLVDIKNHGIDLEDPNNRSFHLERPCNN